MANEDEPWLDMPIIRAAPSLAEEANPDPSVGQAVARGVGLGVRDVIEGVVAPAYDLVGRGINATGILPAIGAGPIKPLSENLTTLGLPAPETPTERVISGVQQPIAGTLTGQGVGRAMMGAASPVVRTVGQALTAQPGTQAASAGLGGATTEATGSPELGFAVSMLSPFGIAGVRQVGRGAGRAVDSAISGGGIDPADAELGKLAIEKYKIPIAAPDLTDNSIIRIGADQASKLPFSGARPAATAKQEAWQGAILTEMGVPGATRFTSKVMSSAADRIGKGLDEVTRRTTIPQPETTTLLDDLGKIIPEAERSGIDAHLPSLTKEIQSIAETIGKNNGTLTGEQYQTLTRTGAPLDRLEHHVDPNVRHFAGRISKALDDAFARSATPEDREAFQQLRYQYRVMRTVDQLAAGSRTGDISPDAFMQAVKTASRRFDSSTGGMAYTGGGNVGELARIGKLMRAPPQTGTAERATINALTAGAVGGAPFVLNPLVAASLPATLAANRAAGGYLRSGALANRLIEGAIGPEVTRPNELMRALRTSGVTGLEAATQKLRR